MDSKAILIVALGVIMIVIGTYFFTTWGPTLLAIEKGDIIPFKINADESFDVQMGGIHFITTVGELSSGLNMSRYLNINNINYPFQVSLKNGKLLISAEIRDKDGNVVANIANNKWVVNPNPVVSYDKNYNSYALEVITANQIPILQVVMTPENKIFVGGVFYSRNTTLLAMLNDTTVAGSTDNAKIANAVNSYNQTIFQYPSETHLGELYPNSQYAFGPQITIAPVAIIDLGYALFGIGSFFVAIGAIMQKNQKPKSRARKRRAL